MEYNPHVHLGRRPVIPAKAGIYGMLRCRLMGPGFRRDDGVWGRRFRSAKLNRVARRIVHTDTQYAQGWHDDWPALGVSRGTSTDQTFLNLCRLRIADGYTAAAAVSCAERRLRARPKSAMPKHGTSRRASADGSGMGVMEPAPLKPMLP